MIILALRTYANSTRLNIERVDIVYESTTLITAGSTASSIKYLAFTKYKKLKFYTVINGNQQHTVILDLTKLNANPFVAGWGYEIVDFVGASDMNIRIWRINIRVASNKDAMHIPSFQYSDDAGASFTTYNNSSTGVYKIEGVY